MDVPAGETVGEEEVFGGIDLDTSSEIEVPPRLIDQVIGQDHAVEVIRKAAVQRRHVMMIGSPGTGKSMLAKAMAELLPKEELQDILVYPNSEDNNNPIIRTVTAGRGKQIVAAHKGEAKRRMQTRNTLLMLLLVGIIGYSFITYQWLMGIIAAAFVFMALRYTTPREDMLVPKLLVSNDSTATAPFIDATGSHAGALLGDVRHDPFQSGGLETPAHDRVEAGAIHRSHGGVLFIDEINSLEPQSQQSLLTSLQEGEFPITGQSERSSGAMVRTEPVPCRFIMVAAGNVDAVQNMNPALRSRIRGYGYEVYFRDSMEDTPDNRRKFVRFIAQEVKKDGKIPHFDRAAIGELIREGRRRSNRKGHLTLKLRDIGGLIRTAGDLARQEGVAVTTAAHVVRAKETARSIEEQISDEYIRRSRDYELTVVDGSRVGRVNGLAVMGTDSGSVLPIMAEVTPAINKDQGSVIATGTFKKRLEPGLQEEESIAEQSIKNVSAIIKKFTGKDIKEMDIHIQFIGTYGAEGDSASISVATAVISAIEGIPVHQDLAMTGSLSVRGDVLPVGGVTYKIEAAAKAGIHTVLIPKANAGDVLIEERYRDKVEIIPVENIEEVLTHALIAEQREGFLTRIRSLAVRSSAKILDTALPKPVV
ncbi:MAG: ATP-dependent protease LonB [Methanomicrobiales archaeon]|nr:peptidase Lon-like protease [Methanomicrobia archaeon]MDD1639867.1 ATP-dependent protease LonB [Methanomicrobiales archaeon]MDD1645128.1 ATP-dependent protease LonB [Methanomicrobiales archaeon]MDD1647206.1 ATP-dependent protease LonB [Methanomicrobiales archaeon]MDD1648053.1 ATP-dependent protease LonB [Methanomicrobiales archaeon]